MWPFSRPPAAAAPRPGDETLFDESFRQKLDMLALVSRRAASGRQRAARRSKRRGAGIEFADFREYAPGDDFRDIDTAAYERLGRWVLRLREEEADLAVTIVLDCSASMAFESGAKLRLGKQLAAALGYVTLGNLDRLALLTVRDRIVAELPPMRGKAQIHRVFRFLDAVSGAERTDLGEALSRFVVRPHRRGLVVLISDFHDHAGMFRGLERLRFHGFEACAIHLRDEEDVAVPPLGETEVEDCETGESLPVTVQAATRHQLRARWAEEEAALERHCRAHHVAYLPAPVTTAFDELVLRTFRRGGFLR